MNNLYELTAKELRDKFLSDELSAVEIVNSFYKRIEKGIDGWIEVLNKGAQNSVIAILNTALVVGFAGVVSKTKGFSILIEKLKSKFGVDIKTVDLKVPYRETIKGNSDVQGKYKKQSGGHGQYGDVLIKFSYADEDFVFEETITGGSVPKSYIPAVEKGLRESLKDGVLAGYPVTNVKAVLYDGSYHDVDSSELAFKIAANLAFKKGMLEAKPILLEPIMELIIIVPEEYIGDIMGDINKKRGRVLGMEAHKGTKQKIIAEAPMSETFKYANELKAITQGRGYFEMKLVRYEELMGDLAQKVIEKRQKQK